MSTFNKIIGLSGTFASGKNTLSQYLVEKYHYLHISTADMVRDEAQRLHGSIERPVLHETAKALRQSRGAGVLVELAIEVYESKKADYAGVVISDMRSLGEAKAIKAAGGLLLFVDAPIELRYQRMVSRKRDDETKLTLDEFKAQEAKELQSTDTSDAAFNLLGIRDMSDCLLTNQSSPEALFAEAERALGG